jgi:hypothetical protein
MPTAYVRVKLYANTGFLEEREFGSSPRNSF